MGDRLSSFMIIPSVESMTASTEESTLQEFLTATNHQIDLCVVFGCIFLPPNLLDATLFFLLLSVLITFKLELFSNSAGKQQSDSFDDFDICICKCPVCK